VQLAGQGDRDEDVFLAGEHQGGDGDPAEPGGGVVLLDHRELGEVGGDRLVHVLHGRLELGQLARAVTEELGGERPQRDVPHDEREAEHRRGIGPHREHPGAERPRRRVRAGHDHRPEVLRVGQRVFLDDHPAHGHAEQVEPGDAEMIHQCLGVVGQQPGRVGPGGLAGLADTAVVEHQQPVAGLGQFGFLERPGLQVVGEPVDQDDGLRAVAAIR
jgi:hypothetical protein